MTLDILICTIDEGIGKVPHVLMPPQDDIHYLVSMQHTRPHPQRLVPQALTERQDVEVIFLEGRGLSRNRNHAIGHARGDVLLMADDDNRYTPELTARIFRAYEAHPEAEVICFAAESYEGQPMKAYPTETMTYREAVHRGYYPTSMEMSLRRGLGLSFDERFGLGSPLLCAGEEEVFMKDAQTQGYTCLFVPEVVVRSRYETTGRKFVGNAQLQRSKGATFNYVFGTPCALWRTVKEAGWWLVHQRANPFPILLHMLQGILLFRHGKRHNV